MTPSLPRTSQTHPIRIDHVDFPQGGRIGMTFCPGKRDTQAMTGAWHRELDTDLAAIQAWGASLLVMLVETHELALLQVPDLQARLEYFGIQCLHLPIVDVSIPDSAFEANWPTAKARIVGMLSTGDDIVLHCRGGLGRTGLVAAWLLIEAGIAPCEAISVVRRARPGTIETPEQERYVLARRQNEF